MARSNTKPAGSEVETEGQVFSVGHELARATKKAVFGPPFGIYLWAWTLVVTLLLGPAFLLASLLRTPGCEMLAFQHAWSKLGRGRAEFSPCPGWIDQFDSVRLFGKW